MSKSFYMQSKVLHTLPTTITYNQCTVPEITTILQDTLPKFALTTQRFQVGNGQYVAVLFIVLVIIEIHSHLFEVFTLVSEIHDNADLVLGMKNAYELEGIVDM